MKTHVNGIELAYDDVGAGTPVLWVHGFPLNRSFWAPQIESLGDGMRHVAPDLRGFGESGPPDGPCSMDVYATDLKALLDHLGVERVVVAGLSMGGYVAMAFARLFAERLRALALVDTRVAPDSAGGARSRRDNAARVVAQGVTPVLADMLPPPKMLSPHTVTHHPDVVRRLESIYRDARPEGVRAALLAIADRPDSSATLTSLAVPTLIVVGQDDLITPPPEARHMAALAPHARFEEVPRAGHVPNLEQPAAFNQIMRAFVGSLTAV